MSTDCQLPMSMKRASSPALREMTEAAGADRRGKTSAAAGSVLAHYDPVREGSGSGVAVATGWQAAGHILAEG